MYETFHIPMTLTERQINNKLKTVGTNGFARQWILEECHTLQLIDHTFLESTMDNFLVADKYAATASTELYNNTYKDYLSM